MPNLATRRPHQSRLTATQLPQRGSLLKTPPRTPPLDTPLDAPLEEILDDLASEDLTPPTPRLAAAPFDQSQTVSGVTVTVRAEAGVFPAGAELEVARVPRRQAKAADAAIEDVRDGDANVAASYTFDIKVIDSMTKEEIQPADGQSVSVSFALAEAADGNLEASVYHITEEGGDLTAEKLESDVDGEAVTATTDGFSLYTVEFTYDTLQYVLEGGESAPLMEITTAVGLQGEATPVSVSDESLFRAAYEGGAWVIQSLRPFTTEEWMKVEIGGVSFTITVTDSSGSVDYVDENGNKLPCTECSFVQSSDVNWNAGWHVVNADTTINGRVTVTGNVNLILCDGKTLTAKQGITVEGSNSLTVYAQSKGTGAMIAGKDGNSVTCPERCAGIGGINDNGKKNAGTITITGGNVTAKGGEHLVTGTVLLTTFPVSRTVPVTGTYCTLYPPG